MSVPEEISPPHLVERVLARTLPRGEWRDEILGDLHEEYGTWARQSGRWGASARYTLEAVRLGGHRAWREIRASGPGVSTGRQGMGRGIWSDVRVGLRAVRTRPGLSAVMILTLAVALGANATVFSLVDALILRPLPFDAPDSLVLIAESAAEDDLPVTVQSVAPASFVDWRASLDTVSGLAAADYWEPNLSGRDGPEGIRGFRVTPGYLSILGVKPIFGRGFRGDEETLGAHQVAVLGYALWSRHFGADPQIVGENLILDGESYTVVGIAPQGFDFPMGAEVWVPLALTAEETQRRDARYLTVVGKLAPGRTLVEAQAQLAVVDERLRTEYPDQLASRRARVMSLAEGVRDIGIGAFLAVVQFSAALVLLIACANVANLLLARGAERQRELALRLALGAARSRIARQLLTESSVIALCAGAAAIPLAHIATGLLRTSMPATIARFLAGWQQVDVDGRILLFTTGLALVAVLVFGMLPALAATRPQLAQTLRDGGRSATAGAQRQIGRNLLVVSEVALAFALLVASVLSASAALRMLNGPQGYDPSGIATARATLPEARYAEPESKRLFAQNLLERLEALPGVERAMITNVLPSSGTNRSSSVSIEGAEYTGAGDGPRANWRSVSPDYFETLGLQILSGRAFTEADTDSAAPVAIVSETFARRHWPGLDPLGRRVSSDDTDDTAEKEWATVVGVCGDVIHHWFAARALPTLLRPMAQAPTRSIAVAVRVAGEPEAILGDLRRAVTAVDPEQPIHTLRSQQEGIADTTIGLRYAASIMTAFAVLAFVLAISGVYGMMAFRITQRTQEIGVRIALGASRGQILGLTLTQVARMTAAGLAAGLLLAIGLAKAMEGALASAVRMDAATFLGAALALALAALVAGYVPARRALSVDPSLALRSN